MQGLENQARSRPIAVLVHYRTLPDQAVATTKAIPALIAAVQSVELGYAGITMLQDAADPTQITLIEKWPSRETFLGPHMQQPPHQVLHPVRGRIVCGAARHLNKGDVNKGDKFVPSGFRDYTPYSI